MIFHGLCRYYACAKINFSVILLRSDTKSFRSEIISKTITKMIEVDNFLIAFSLEIGGKFIGFFALITNTIVLPLAILLLIAVSIDKDFLYLREQLELMEIQVFNIPEASDEKALKHLREYIIISLVFLIIIAIIYIIAGYMLVRGTKNVRKFYFFNELLKLLLLAKSSPD